LFPLLPHIVLLFLFGDCHLSPSEFALKECGSKEVILPFHAFDRHNYLRMIPHHLADLLTFPKEVLNYFELGCFSVSFSGEDCYSLALDEAHEMDINLKTKNPLNSFSPTSLTTITFYLTYRAETLITCQVIVHVFLSVLSKLE
jgi:hypothetical protein